MSEEKVFQINFTPHMGQIEVLKTIASSKADIVVIDAARGWGKSLFSTCNLVLPVLLEAPHTQIQWVAPTYKICKAPIDDVWYGMDERSGDRFIPQFDPTGFKFWDFNKSDMEITLFNESKIYFRSADNPDSIVAKGYNLVIVDEAALISKDVFHRSILPTARRAGCKIVLISTPRGKNWFYEMYLSGQDLAKPEYISFRQPWWKRPDYPDVLKRLMQDLPSHLREQEFEAEFVGSGGGVFKNLENVFKGNPIQFPEQQQEWREPLTQHEIDSDLWVLSVDFAKSNDFTVLTVMGSESRRIVYYSRFNKTDYRVVLERVKRIANYFNADVIYDNTGVGGGISDFLSSDLNVVPFTFTNESKTELINKLILACEYGEIQIPNIRTIREEFELFSFEMTKTGKISYSAPDGKHDDAVVAIALANFYCADSSGKNQVQDIENFFEVMNEVYRPKSKLEQLIAEDD